MKQTGTRFTVVSGRFDDFGADGPGGGRDAVSAENKYDGEPDFGVRHVNARRANHFLQYRRNPLHPVHQDAGGCAGYQPRERLARADFQRPAARTSTISATVSGAIQPR